MINAATFAESACLVLRIRRAMRTDPLLLAGLALIYGVTWLAWTRDLWTGGDPFDVAAREVVR